MQLPANYRAFLDLSPDRVSQLSQELMERALDAVTIESWLRDWAALAALFQESLARYNIATEVNTADEAAQERLRQYRETIFPIGLRLNQRLHERLQAHADLLPAPLRATLERQASAERLNTSPAALDLLNRESELCTRFESINGAQTVTWEGVVMPLRQLRDVLRDADRQRRERAWRTMQQQHQQVQAQMAAVWAELLDVRLKLAEVNGFDDYLSYRWVQLGRSDYTPADSAVIHDALRRHWSPLHARLMESRRSALGIETVRPWDVHAPLGDAPPAPHISAPELLNKTLNVFQRIDADFAATVRRLRDTGFIDLAQRQHTSSVGGFSLMVGRSASFIFMNFFGAPGEGIGLIHELGHAISNIASGELPYMAYWGFPADFSESPSTAMEMLSIPYWDEFFALDALQGEQSGYFAGVLGASLNQAGNDAFQHWVYRHPEQARDLTQCAAKELELRQQFLPGIDWAGLGTEMEWHLPSMGAPLHTLEYFYGWVTGLRLLSLPPTEAVARYKAAIALGNSVPTAALFQAMGIRFPFTEADLASAATELAARGGIR